MSVYWPVTLREQIPTGLVRLRPMVRKDEKAWADLRRRNYNWLIPWEATNPGPKHGQLKFPKFIQMLDDHAMEGISLPWAIEFNGQLVGQITVSSISYGSLCSATIGYWIAQSAAGHGVMPTAVALATDYCFWARSLHRIEINIRPDNQRSLRVVEKLGFRDEGVRQRYLHINGEWADHRTFALTKEEVPNGLLTRWRAQYGLTSR
jgi:[ribosomal protein S5]-alanine N-acetyltransferase